MQHHWASGFGPSAASAERAKVRERSLWRHWFAVVTVGEVLGFAGPAVVGALMWDAAPAPMVIALLLAGAFEGSVLGWFQARVLRRAIPEMPSSAWVLATAAGALIAWPVGVVPAMASDSIGDLPLAVSVPATVAGGTIILLSLGTAQWFVLRRYVSHAAQWIWATALAWLCGLLAFTAVTSPLWQPGQSAALVILIGVLGGLVMAAGMAAVTGLALTRLLRGGPRPA